jgi:hypothetical protein
MNNDMPHWLDEDEIGMLGPAVAGLHGNKSDPVMRYNCGWVFWDETWSRCKGPFDQEEECRVAHKKYAETL